MKTLDELKELAQSAGSDCVAVFGGRYDGGYRLQQCIDEIAPALFDLQDRVYENYLEIGVAAAGLTRIMTDVLEIGNIYTVDLGEHHAIPLSYADNIANLRNYGKLHSFIGDSHSPAAAAFLADAGVSFDLVVIDGDHSYEGVKQDTLLALEHMPAGGRMFFHDHAAVPAIGRWFAELANGILPRIKLRTGYVGAGPCMGISIFEVQPCSSR